MKWITIRDNNIFKTFKNLNDDEILRFIINKPSIFPTFIGSFDHIKRCPKGIYVYDIGCNGRDNSFVVLPE